MCEKCMIQLPKIQTPSGNYIHTLYRKKKNVPKRVTKHSTTIEFLNGIKEAYDAGERQFYTATKFWKEIVEGFVAAHLTYKKNYGTILDVGTGTGFATMYLAHRFPNARIIGVDIESHPVRETYWRIIKNMYDNVDFIVDDVRNAIDKINPDLIVGVHNCRELSIIDIELAKEYGSDLVLIPCCSDFNALARRGVDLSFMNILDYNDERKYLKWVLGLAMYARQLGLKVETGESSMLKKFTNRYAFIRAF